MRLAFGSQFTRSMQTAVPLTSHGCIAPCIETWWETLMLILEFVFCRQGQPERHWSRLSVWAQAWNPIIRKRGGLQRLSNAHSLNVVIWWFLSMLWFSNTWGQIFRLSLHVHLRWLRALFFIKLIPLQLGRSCYRPSQSDNADCREHDFTTLGQI